MKDIAVGVHEGPGFGFCTEPNRMGLWYWYVFLCTVSFSDHLLFFISPE
jgi:hypothetical protein